MAGKKKVFIDAHTPESLAAFMFRYLEWMAVTNYSPSTVAARKADLHLFNEWCKTRSLTTPQEITKSVLEGFFKWLAQNDTIPFNPASELILPKVPKQLPKDILSIDEVESG